MIDKSKIVLRCHSLDIHHCLSCHDNEDKGIGNMLESRIHGYFVEHCCALDSKTTTRSQIAKLLNEYRKSLR